MKTEDQQFLSEVYTNPICWIFYWFGVLDTIYPKEMSSYEYISAHMELNSLLRALGIKNNGEKQE